MIHIFDLQPKFAICDLLALSHRYDACKPQVGRYRYLDMFKSRTSMLELEFIPMLSFNLFNIRNRCREEKEKKIATFCFHLGILPYKQ